MLTDNQKEIIADLTAEFEGINTPTKAKGGFLDIEHIKSVADSFMTRKAEIEAINKAKTAKRTEIMLADIKLFKEKLEPLGFVIENSHWTTRIEGRIYHRNTYGPARHSRIVLDIEYRNVSITDSLTKLSVLTEEQVGVGSNRTTSTEKVKGASILTPHISAIIEAFVIDEYKYIKADAEKYGGFNK